MIVEIDGTQYTEIKNLSFIPQIDISADTVPINDLSVDINTDNDIPVGMELYLYDDMYHDLCKYIINYADRVDAEFVRVEASSMLYALDNERVQAEYVSGITFKDMLDYSVFVNGFVFSYEIEPTLAAKIVTGFFPEQSKRDRLQWLLLAYNAYADQQTGYVYFRELDQQTTTDIPKGRTYWKPSVQYADYVTAIKLTYYSFVEGVPAQGDKYVEDWAGTQYIVTENTLQLNNPNVPQTALPNVIEIDGVMSLNSNNVSEVASRLALLYFTRIEAQATVLCDDTYIKPATKVRLYLDDTRTVTGYVESASYRVGARIAQTLKLVACTVLDVKRLIVSYVYGDMILDRRRFSFPIGFNYEILNPILDIVSPKHRYVYRPLNEYATGTIIDGENTNTQQCDVALHWYSDQSLLHILSVSEIEQDGSVVDIG